MARGTWATAIQLPTVSASGDELKIECKWHNKTYGPDSGHDQAKYMDVWCNINGHWWETSHGASVGESETYSCQLEEIKSWAPKWKPIKSVQYSFRFNFGKYFGVWYYSPILTLVVPKQPEITIKQTEKDGTPYIEVTVTREKSVWNCPALLTRGSVSIGVRPGYQGPPSVDQFESTDETWTKEYPLSMLSEELSAPVAVTVKANAIGLAGNSSTAVKTYYIAHPNVPTIKSIIASREKPTVVVNFASNEDTTHPVDYIELYRLRDSEIEYASEAALASSWNKVDSTFAHAVSMCDALADSKPTARGKRTWYRLNSVHGSHHTYSTPFELPIYDAPLSASAAAAYISSVYEADDGHSLAVEVAWRDIVLEGATQAELSRYEFKTEVSWGTSPYSWQSNKGADTFDFDWECEGAEKTERLALINANRPSVDGEPIEAFTHVGVVYIDGMDEDSAVYVKARRSWKSDDDEGYGEYSNMVVASLNGAANVILLTAPSTVRRGDGIGLMWTLGVDVKQSQWLVSGIVGPDDDMMENFAGLVSESTEERAAAKAALDNACIGLASGYDAGGYAVIEPDALSGAQSVLVKVSATIGGMTDESAYALVTIADAPTCEVEAPETVTETPAALTVRTSTGENVVVSVISRGIAHRTPHGMDYQLSGDVVFGGAKTISDLELTDDGLYEGTVSLEGAALVDGATYDVHAYVVDEVTGLESDIATDTFTVAWAHQASAPSALIAASSAELTASIVVEAPDDALDTDVCDVYRVTPHGADLIAEDVAFGSTVTDRLAPYVSRREESSTAYRIACRTKDGDVEYADVDYILHGNALRLDWGEGESLTLPYNLTVSESTEKLFEASTMLDGSRIGSWQEGVERSGGLTTDLIRFESAEQRRLVYEVAAYPGPVFVRCASGLAFEADVQIDSVEESYDSGAIAVSLNFTQIDLTDAHRVSIDDVSAPEAEDEQV